MFQLWEVMMLLITHWVADFVCQDDNMAVNKSHKWEALLTHTGIYSGIMTVIAMIILSINKGAEGIGCGMLFGMITFAVHTATDYYTSKAHATLWKEEKRHDFFTSIGFDKLLHYAQLFVTYQLLKQW